MMYGNQKEESRNGRKIAEKMRECFTAARDKVDLMWIAVRCQAMKQDQGIDGILVTVGLCIIALLLCVVMKNSLSEFIKSIVSSMTKEASDILTGNRV